MGQDPAANGRRFHVHACLGRGGFGEVYRATMSSSGGVRTEVAVKILRADIDPGSEAVKRLRDEGRLLGALRHPAILRVHDLVLLEDRVALVTEYVEGQDLDRCMHADPPMPLRALVAVIGDVAAALDAAWSTLSPTTGQPIHLVHRDVKPANIRIGKHGEVKLLDFGIARATNVAREAHTANNAMMGSYLYMAPERFHEDSVDPPSDIFALGCVLFEGIAGTRLFEGMTLKQIYGTMLSSRKYSAHVEQRFEAIPEKTPPEVMALLRAMLDVDADERPAANEVARRCEDLAEELQGPTLKRWARHREWPGPELMPGTLDGRELTAHSFVSMGVELEADVEEAPLPRAIQATSLPPINLMALPSPGQTALDAPDRPRTPAPEPAPEAESAPPPPPPEPEPEPQPEPEPPAPEPDPEPPAPDPVPPAAPHDEDEPGLPEPGSYFAIEHTGEVEPIPGVLEETTPPPPNDDFEEQLLRMLQARRRRRMMFGILAMGLMAAVVLGGVGVVVTKPELLEAITAATASAGDDSEGLAPRVPDPEPEPEPEPEPNPEPEVKPEPKPKAKKPPPPPPPKPEPPPPPKPEPAPEPKPDPKPAAPSASSLVAQGWQAVEGGDNAGALSLFDQALALAPGSAEGSYGRGYALLELGRTDDGLASMCQAAAKGDRKMRNEVTSILTRKGLACP